MHQRALAISIRLSRRVSSIGLPAALLAFLALVAARALPAQTSRTTPAPSPDAVRRAAVSWRTAHESEILGELRDLLAMPNVASDSANIRRNAAQIRTMFERRGVSTRLLEVPGASPAVYGELRTPGATRTLIFYAHYDGQPVDRAQWARDPWAPVLLDRAMDAGGRPIEFPASGAHVDEEARVYARSASDDKGPIIAMLAALDALRSAQIAPSVNLKFFFDGEEEAGSPNVARILAANHDLLAADAWIFCDGPVHQSGAQQVLFGVRGVMTLGITMYGPARALHSGHYGNWAPNPAAELANLLARLRDDDGRILIPGFYSDVRALSAAERRAIMQLPPVDSSLRRSLLLAHTEQRDALLGERISLPALNVTGLRSGQVGAGATNAVPATAEAAIDFRFVPDQRPERVRRLVEAHLRTLGYFVTTDSVTPAMRLAHAKVVRLNWGAGYPAMRTPMELPVSQSVLRAIRDGGVMTYAVPMLGGSLPMYAFSEALKVPLIVLPTVNYDNNQHASNENLRVGNLWKAIESLAAVMGRVTW